MLSRMLFAILMAAVTAVSAQTSAGGQEVTISACRADVQKYCPQMQGKQAFDCLLDHQQHVSDACYDGMKKQMDSGEGQQAEGAAGRQACRQDVQQFCKGVRPGGGRIVDCLLEHRKDLSDACYEAMSKRMKSGKR